MAGFSYGAGAVALTPQVRPGDVAALLSAARQRVPGQGVVVSINGQHRLPPELTAAAADAVAGSSDVEVYVVGDGAQLQPDELTRFRAVRHLNLNAHNLPDYGFLSEFGDLDTLTIQGHSRRPVALDFLRRMPHLTTLRIPAGIRDEDALRACWKLVFLSCSSGEPIFRALAGHPSLTYLDVHFGNDRDLSALAAIPRLRGVSLYQVRGLDGDDLAPLGECADLSALSLGALRNVTHLSALRGLPATKLKALLIERLQHQDNLDDIAHCTNLTQLGLYEARPVDKSLIPLRRLESLSHLVLGDVYPKAEIDGLLSWYQGSIRYRDKIERGEFRPRWRTRIDRLDQNPD